MQAFGPNYSSRINGHTVVRSLGLGFVNVSVILKHGPILRKLVGHGASVETNKLATFNE